MRYSGVTREFLEANVAATRQALEALTEDDGDAAIETLEAWLAELLERLDSLPQPLRIEA